jgi:hypothetical protein
MRRVLRHWILRRSARRGWRGLTLLHLLAQPAPFFVTKPPSMLCLRELKSAGPDVVVRWIFVEGACNELSTNTQHNPRISPPDVFGHPFGNADMSKRPGSLGDGKPLPSTLNSNPNPKHVSPSRTARSTPYSLPPTPLSSTSVKPWVSPR